MTWRKGAFNEGTPMNLILHTSDNEGSLSRQYQRAFAKAVELFIVTAYLTDWDDDLELNPHCRRFRIIIGRDFGITRKAACRKVIEWLPEARKFQFKVADQITGFHPKAVFWKEANGDCFAIIGSSNLTRAAFEMNYEANVYGSVSANDYAAAKVWIRRIEASSVIVSEAWLTKYVEGTRVPSGSSRSKQGAQNDQPLASLPLPRPEGLRRLVSERRDQLAAFQGHKAGLTQLFRRCADGDINSPVFYERLSNFWSGEIGDRLQGRGWEIKGMHSDFRALSESVVKIIDADNDDRDDVVAEEIDNLAEAEIPTRRAFLSEMLCLNFPDKYPLINDPVHKYLSDIKFRSPRGFSEGARYIYCATMLRAALLQNPTYPAKNLAELDLAIWGKYGRPEE